jgi:Mce-associated membrane protein
MTSTPSPPKQAVRRRASRAAGPVGGNAVTTAVRVEEPAAEPRPKAVRKSGAPPRRPAHRRLVAVAALIFGFVASGAVATAVTVMFFQQRDVDAGDAHNQRYVDTASQTVVNMFSFKQNTVEDSVNRFYGGTSGPLRDMLSQNNNVDNLKAMFRDTGASSEAVINGAALEGVDAVSKNASVLVSVRVTVSDDNGNNRPSQPYRMRIVVHEDDNGRMSAWDLKYPNGGN